MSELAQKREELLAKQKQVAGILEEGKGPDGRFDLERVKSIEGTPDEKAQKIRDLKGEMDRLGLNCEVLAIGDRLHENERRLGEALEGPWNPSGGAKSLGEMYTDSTEFKTYRSQGRGNVGGLASLQVDPRRWLGDGTKAVMSTGAGWAPQAIRTGTMIPFATRPVQITDLIPQGETSQSQVVYMEETTFTNAAVETAEAGLYPEATLVLTERNSPVRKIPVFLPVTDEQLDDIPQVRGYIDNRLPFMVRQRLDGQIFNGTGVVPNLTGLLNVAGIQTQAKGADPAMTAIFKAMVKVMVTGRAIPSGHIIHPTDWQAIRVLQDTTGRYIWGSPSEATPDRLWGLPVAQCDAGAAGTAAVADFANFTELDFRRNIDVQVGFVNDDFARGKKSIRADVRVAFVVYRPAAVCTVTGL